MWSEGGYYARVFFNVKGREPQRHDRAGGVREVPRRDEGALRGDHRRPGPAAGHAGVQAGGDLPHRAQRGARPHRALRRRCTGARSAASGIRRSTSRRTTPVPTTATTRSSARFILAAPGSPAAGRDPRARTCSTSRPRCWSWAATTCPPRCRGRRCWPGEALGSERDARGDAKARRSSANG